MSGATKTTFILSDSRRARLKGLAARSGKTVTELLEEGADLVLDKYAARGPDGARSARASRTRAPASGFVLGTAGRGRRRAHLVAGPRVALDFLKLFESRVAGEDLLLLEVNSERRSRAVDLFRRLAPKVPRISFTDSTSLTLMRELDIGLAFTADAHFRAAGRVIRPLFARKGKLLLPQPPES